MLNKCHLGRFFWVPIPHKWLLSVLDHICYRFDFCFVYILSQYNLLLLIWSSMGALGWFWRIFLLLLMLQLIYSPLWLWWNGQYFPWHWQCWWSLLVTCCRRFLMIYSWWWLDLCCRQSLHHIHNRGIAGRVLWHIYQWFHLVVVWPHKILIFQKWHFFWIQSGLIVLLMLPGMIH